MGSKASRGFVLGRLSGVKEEWLSERLISPLGCGCKQTLHCLQVAQIVLNVKQSKTKKNKKGKKRKESSKKQQQQQISSRNNNSNKDSTAAETTMITTTAAATTTGAAAAATTTRTTGTTESDHKQCNTQIREFQMVLSTLSLSICNISFFSGNRCDYYYIEHPQYDLPRILRLFVYCT